MTFQIRGQQFASEPQSARIVLREAEKRERKRKNLPGEKETEWVGIAGEGREVKQLRGLKLDLEPAA